MSRNKFHNAYYNYEVSGIILEIINQFDNMQSMVTTYNVISLSTDVIRLDCAHIINKRGVINLCERAEKKLRKTHNIEKLYRSGELDTYIKNHS